MAGSSPAAAVAFAVYRRGDFGRWHPISRSFPDPDQAERYAAELAKDWVLEVRPVVFPTEIRT